MTTAPRIHTVTAAARLVLLPVAFHVPQEPRLTILQTDAHVATATADAHAHQISTATSPTAHVTSTTARAIAMTDLVNAVAPPRTAAKVYVPPAGQQTAGSVAKRFVRFRAVPRCPH